MVTPMQTPEFVYKVVSREVYDASIASGTFVGQPIDKADGYIHLSTAAQLPETIRLYFAGLTDQVLFQLACGSIRRGDEVGGIAQWRTLPASLRRTADARAGADRPYRRRRRWQRRRCRTG